jgi:glycosyltransferase involved in cell wall biosynthesis
MNNRARSDGTLRICHLGKYYPPAPGGIESHVRTLAVAQAELGLDVQVLCVNHEPGPTRTDRDGSVEVTRLGRTVKASKLDMCPELIAALRGIDADILHLHVPNPTMILALLWARPKAQVVVTYHSDVIKQKVLGALFRPFERLAYRKVRAILPTSPDYAGGSRFLRSYGDRLEVLPHGIELDEYLHPSEADQETAETLRRAHPGPLWVGCGRLVYYKGFLNAVRALTRVAGTLILVGEGPERGALEAEAVRLGVADRLVFAGRAPRLAPYYLAATAFWFPSNARSEAFGLVQVEAMAAGCPVINTAIPHSGVAWVSRHDREGLTVPVDDPLALAEAANRIATEPGLRDRLVEASRRRAREEFDHRVMTRRCVDIYRRVLDGGTVAMPTLRAVTAIDSCRGPLS